MGGLTKQYVITRMFMWILTIWIGATAIFFIPRLAPGDPVTAMVMRMAEVRGPRRKRPGDDRRLEGALRSR